MHSNPVRLLTALSGLLLMGCFESGVHAEFPPEFTRQVQSFPNILRAKDGCSPLKGSYTHPQTYVCDTEGLLTVSQINRLNDVLQEVRNRDGSSCSLSNPHPVIAVALVNKLKVGNENPDRLLSYASVFAYYLFSEWNLPSNCHTGSDKMIIFYSKDDGVLYTFAGNLLQRRLSSKQLIDIAVTSRGSFSHGIYEGLAYLIDEYRMQTCYSKSMTPDTYLATSGVSDLRTSTHAT